MKGGNVNYTAKRGRVSGQKRQTRFHRFQNAQNLLSRNLDST